MDIEEFSDVCNLDELRDVVGRLCYLAYFNWRYHQIKTFTIADAVQWFLSANLPAPNQGRLKKDLKASSDFNVVDGRYRLRNSSFRRIGANIPANLQDEAHALRSNGSTYIAMSRIEALEGMQGSRFDLSRVLQICRELNSAHRAGNVISIAALIRAFLDHIPPVFGCEKFVEVANNTAGRSLKPILLKLQESSRNISDRQLHEVIKRHVDVPTLQQVDFSPEFDALLGELIGRLKCEAQDDQRKSA